MTKNDLIREIVKYEGVVYKNDEQKAYLQGLKQGSRLIEKPEKDEG